MNLKKPSSIILLLVWCLFMGVTAISIGFGAAFPALNRIAGPVVCPNGDMLVDEQTYRPSPGTTVTTMDWLCVDGKTGEAQPINELSMFLFNGLIYGTILFAIIMLSYWLIMKRRAQRVAARATVDDSNSYTSVDLPPGAYVTSLDKYELQELTRQYKAGQFSEKEYQRKRKEILDGVAKRADATSPTSHAQLESFNNNELQELMRKYAAGQVTDVEYWQNLSQIHDRTANPSGNLGDYVQQELTRQYEAGSISKEEYERKKAKLASRLHFSESTSGAHPSAAISPDSREEDDLRKLKSLLDEGLITQQDYDQKKAEILSRL